MKRGRDEIERGDRDREESLSELSLSSLVLTR